MSIKHYIKEIGRGKDGAKPLSREQARDLMGQILDERVSDMELGAFCLAMRIKGETDQEMAGFLDATQERLNYFKAPSSNTPVIVIPTYNGARRLPVLTPLLGLLLAKEGFAVLMHGSSSENERISSQSVLDCLGYQPTDATCNLIPGELVFTSTQVISKALHKLLAVRDVIGLRNSAHSLVKLIQPIGEKNSIDPTQILITSYTHPEYSLSMRSTLTLTKANALLLRGCEGEPVADARRSPAYALIEKGHVLMSIEGEKGSISGFSNFNEELNASGIANYSKQIVDGKLPAPQSILDQIGLIKKLAYTSKI